MLFRKKIQRSCAYCLNGTLLEDDQVLCTKKGLRSVEDSCRKFKYDPFKRVPVKAKPIDFSQFNEHDFSL